MKQKETIKQQVISLLFELTNSSDFISGNTILHYELNMDSMDRAELSIHVEETFHVHMDSSWRNWRTVDDVVQTIMDLRYESQMPHDYLTECFNSPACTDSDAQK